MPAIESSTTAPANIEKMYNIYINLDIFLSPFSAFSFAAILGSPAGEPKKWLSRNHQTEGYEKRRALLLSLK